LGKIQNEAAQVVEKHRRDEGLVDFIYFVVDLEGANGQ
jgi:hypothetical protein